jgi:hypothetical protein
VLTGRSWSVSLDYRFLKLKQILVGWINYFKIAQCKGLLIELDRLIRRRIRVVIWKTWKKVKTRFTRLIKLGVQNPKHGNGQTRVKDTQEQAIVTF